MAWQFTGPFAFLVSVPLLHSWHPAAPVLAVVMLLGALVVAELGPSNPDVAEPEGPARLFRILPVVYVPAQIALAIWALELASGPDLPWLHFASLTSAVGTLSGVFGMLAAHDLVHSPKRLEKELGMVMLSFMTYRHFRIAHIYGHHRWVATDRDPGTARLGESFYAFFARTLVGQVVQAWAFERQLGKRKRLSRLANRVLLDPFAYLLIYGTVLAFFGWRSVLFLFLQSLLAILVLELFNYIAHYGLMRNRKADGRFEPLTVRHSWNTSNALANKLIFNMGRHSDHHRRATAPYQTLEPVARAPELPAGYAGSIVLALLPPLWRRIMDPAVQRVRDEAQAAAEPSS